MKNTAVIFKYFLPVGLLLIAASAILNELIGLPDFVRGFAMGLGGTFVIAGFVSTIKQRKSMKAAKP